MKHAERSNRRMYLTFYLRVFEKDVFLGFVVDISPAGMMLVSETPMQVGKNYALSMKLPPVSGINAATARFTAACLRSQPDEADNAFYLSGFKMDDLSEEAAAVIKDMIREYSLN